MTCRGTTDDMTSQGSTRGVSYPLWEMVLEARTRLGMNLRDLQEASGVSRAAVNDWKTSRRPPNPGTVRKVSDALGLDFEEALRASRGESPRSESQDFTDLVEQSIWELPLPESERRDFIALHRARKGRTPGAVGY